MRSPSGFARQAMTSAHPAQDVTTVAGFDAVVLGSAVYAGSWRKEAVELAERHGDQFARVPLWLFSSGPLGEDVDDNEEQPKQLPSLRESLAPRDHRVFFGAWIPASLASVSAWSSRP